MDDGETFNMKRVTCPTGWIVLFKLYMYSNTEITNANFNWISKRADEMGMCFGVEFLTATMSILSTKTTHKHKCHLQVAFLKCSNIVVKVCVALKMLRTFCYREHGWFLTIAYSFAIANTVFVFFKVLFLLFSSILCRVYIQYHFVCYNRALFQTNNSLHIPSSKHNFVFFRNSFVSSIFIHIMKSIHTASYLCYNRAFF